MAGGRWTAGRLPGTGRVLIEAVTVFGRSDVWVFGGRLIDAASEHPRTAPYAARFNGRTWKAVPVPGRGDLNAVSAVSAGDIVAVTGLVAVGLGEAVRPQVLDWDGRSWRALDAQPPLPVRSQMYAIFASPREGVWIGGSVPDGPKRTRAAIWHWDGAAWSRATPPGAPSGQGLIVSLAGDGRRGLWAIGEDLSSGAGTPVCRDWRQHGAQHTIYGGSGMIVNGQQRSGPGSRQPLAWARS